MIRVSAASLLILTSAGAVAAEPTAPGPESKRDLNGFAWLKQFQGNWSAGPNGVMRCRVVGKRWVVNEIRFEGQPFSIQTLGYDPQNERFVGTWVDATSSFIWRYTGSLNAAGTAIVLEAKGPDMADPNKMRQYRDTYSFKSKDEIAARAEVLDDAGQWKTFGESVMKRQPE